MYNFRLLVFLWYSLPLFSFISHIHLVKCQNLQMKNHDIQENEKWTKKPLSPFFALLSSSSKQQTFQLLICSSVSPLIWNPSSRTNWITNYWIKMHGKKLDLREKAKSKKAECFRHWRNSRLHFIFYYDIRKFN